MELNWSTFVLEVINFLVLVWILKRFLYQPVLNVIADRRKVIEGRLEEARATQQEATALKAQYEGRLVDWETERRKARDALAQEIERERAHRLADLQAALESEREKARAADDRAEKERRRAVEIQALQQAATFSTRLLEQASGPELEARLINMLIDELRALPADEREGLRTRQQNGLSSAIAVSSAYAIDGPTRESLEQALHAAIGSDVSMHYDQDPGLLAGLRIVVGDWVLAANVRDELHGFAEIARASQ